MKKLLAILLAVMLVLSLAACAADADTGDAATDKADTSGSNKAEEKDEAATYTFKICDTQPDTSLIFKVEEIFGEKLAELSDGRMTLELYPAGQLGNANTCMQMLQTGDLTFFRNDAAVVYDFGVDSHQVVAIPYLFKDGESCFDILSGEIGDRLEQDLVDAEIGFEALGWLIDANRQFFTAKTPIYTMEDMAGIKIRSVEASIYVEYKASLGMNPTPLAMTEVYTSLSTGVVDAAANTLDSFVSNRFYEVCDYFIRNNGMVPVYEMLASSTVLDSLSDEDRAIVFEAWDYASSQYLVLMADLIADQTALCEGEGVTFCDPTDEDKWAAACEWMFEEYGAGYEDIIEEIQNF